jgi:hypothetical protein
MVVFFPLLLEGTLRPQDITGVGMRGSVLTGVTILCLFISVSGGIFGEATVKPTPRLASGSNVPSKEGIDNHPVCSLNAFNQNLNLMTLPEEVALFFVFKTLNATLSGFAFPIYHFSIIMLPLRGFI